MKTPEAPRRVVTLRRFRIGEEPDDECDWLENTVAERIAAVWTLTLECMAMNPEHAGEQRLDRTVVHIQRARR